MAVSDGDTVTVVKDMGLVATVFDERKLSGLYGHLAIGHTRYSTHGASDWDGAQPVYRPVGRAGFALGHNGNLTNTAALAEKVGMLPGSIATDSDVVAELLARSFPETENLATALQAVTAYVDHAQPTRQTAGRTHAEARFERATEPQPLKDRALELLTEGGIAR